MPHNFSYFDQSQAVNPCLFLFLIWLLAFQSHIHPLTAFQIQGAIQMRRPVFIEHKIIF